MVLDRGVEPGLQRKAAETMGTHRAPDWTDPGGVPAGEGAGCEPAPSPADLDPREWTRDVDVFYAALAAVVTAALLGVIAYAIVIS
jgi:hypothetical protein